MSLHRNMLFPFPEASPWSHPVLLLRAVFFRMQPLRALPPCQHVLQRKETQTFLRLPVQAAATQKKGEWLAGILEFRSREQPV